MRKNILSIIDLLNTQLNLGSDDLLIPIKKSNNQTNKKSFVFVVGPNDITEITDEINPAKNDELQICPDCGGDGYILCDACHGGGYQFTRTRIGEKNQITECSNCNGTGDIVCATCGGSGKIQPDTDTTTKEVEKDLVEKAIYNVFNAHTHNTIIGPVKLAIQKLHYSTNGIYVLPNINQQALIKDETIDQELNNIKNQFNLSTPIIIPTVFYY